MELTEIKCVVCPYRKSIDSVRMEFGQFLFDKGYINESATGIDLLQEFKDWEEKENSQCKSTILTNQYMMRKET